MGLQADLTVKLDVSGPQASFTADLDGVLGVLDGIDLPLDPTAVERILSLAGGIDLSSLDLGAASLAGNIRGVAAELPFAGDLIGTVAPVLDIVERFADANPEVAFTGLIDRLSVELDDLEGGPLGAFTRIGAILKDASEIDLLKGLYGIFAELGGAPALGAITLPEMLPALALAIRTLGALMTLEARLAEAERIGLSANGRLDLAAVQEREAVLRAQFDALVAGVAATDVDDPAAVEVTARAVAKAHLDLHAFLGDIADAMTYAAAAVAYLDLPRLLADVEALLGEIRAEDLSVVERAAADLAGKLGPILSLDLGGAPRFTLDALLAQVEMQASELAERIDNIDLSGLTDPLEAGLAEVTQVPAEIQAKIEDVKLAVSSALQQVSNAVRTIPFDTAAAAIRSGADSVGDVLDEVSGVLGSIDAAIGTAVDTLQSALDQAESAIDGFADGIEVVFVGAADFVDGLNLDEVSGEIADRINGFSTTIAKADLAPYFSTAIGAIDTAADVVENVPFSLLPDSMEEEVVALARPIKQTDLAAFRLDIQGALQIGDDGTFTLRPDLEAGIAAIQAKMDALLATVREHDPVHLTATLEPALSELSAGISAAAPQINLAPVRQALDGAKAAVSSIDPAAALQPANDAFDEILAKIDEFSPGALLEGVDTRIDQVREKLVDAIKLREWRGQLDEMQERLLALIALLDLTGLEDDIDRALQELRARIESDEGLHALDGFGAIIAAMLSGSGRSAPAAAFSAVAEWLWGGSAHAHLEGHTAGAAASLKSIDDTIAALDPQALAARLTPALSRLNTAVTAKADGPGKLQLEASLDVVDPIGMLVTVGANRNGAMARLDVALPAVDQLRDLSFAEADAASARLRSALAPFALVPQLLTSVADIVGVSAAAGQGPRGIILAVLDSAPPARLASLMSPVYIALRGRLEALLSSLLDPLRAATDDLIAAIDAIDIGALRADLDAIHANVRSEIAAFKPDTLLAAPLAAFTAQQTAFAAFDPLGALDDALTGAEETALRVIARLDPVELVATPQAIFDEIIGALERLDVGKLLVPIFDQLDAIASQIDAGLEGTVGAFKRLQDALPDRVGSTSLSASVSVSVN